MAVPLASSLRTGSGRSERPTFEFEEQLWQQGKQLVAGLDEVGRGALAGPVVAAACVFAPGVVVPDELNDSKRLSPKRRQALVEWIRREAVAWAVGAASHREIDRFGIVRATLLAMTRALERLGPVDHVLYDGLPIPAFPFSAATAVVGGDCRSVSIAAASIVAKVVRDDVMRRVARRFPVYGWDENAGYGTAAHRSAIARCGLTPLHRRTFRGGGTGEET